MQTCRLERVQKVERKMTDVQNHHTMFYGKIKTIANNLKIQLEEADGMKKSEWKRKVKESIQEQVQKRTEAEMENKTKMRTINKDKWERKDYIRNCDSDIIKDVIKIKLHMWELKKNYPGEAEDITYPLCKENEDTTDNRTCARV